MQYMLLIYGEESKEPEYGTPEFDKYMGDYFSFSEKIEKSGQLVAGEALEDRAQAKTVAVRDGRTNIVDGPFAETKEQFGGFYLVDVNNIDEAIALAAEIPTAKHGRVEVRPVMDYGNK